MQRSPWHDTVPGCSGPCDQGRRDCPCREACTITHKRTRSAAGARWGLVLMAASACFVIAALASLAGLLGQ